MNMCTVRLAEVASCHTEPCFGTGLGPPERYVLNKNKNKNKNIPSVFALYASLCAQSRRVTAVVMALQLLPVLIHEDDACRWPSLCLS
jgi:hypothetical protein